MNNIENLITKVDAAKDKLNRAILAEIDAEARKAGLDELSFGWFTIAKKNNTPIEIPDRIKELETIFKENVNARGFWGNWKPDTRWG